MGDYVVYVHRNKVNGKRYVGITNNTSKRWYGKGKKYENCPHFWAAIQKYGWDGFTHEIILSGLTLDEANVAERYYIAKFKTCDKSNGYNIQPGGDFVPSMKGKHHSDETRQKMRKSALGRVISEEQRQNHSKWMSENMVGKRNSRSRAVRCLNTGEVFESQRIAAQEKGVLQSKIWKCCNGKASHTHGLKWEYVEV